MKVSIVVPNFNHARFLRDNLESIRTQRFEDFEVWVADNKSEDNSLEIAYEYAEKDSRFHVGVSTEHHPSAAHNINDILFNYAKGEIALWLNADDKFKENYLHTIVPYFDDPLVGYVRIAMTVYFDDRDVISNLQLLYWDKVGEQLVHNKVYPPSPFRRKHFLEIGGMDENCRFYDWDFWARMALAEVEQGFKHGDCHNPIVIRRVHTPEWNTKDEEIWDERGQSSKAKIGFVQTGALYIYKKLKERYETVQDIHLPRS